MIKSLGLEYEEKSLEKDFDSDPSKMMEDIGKPVRTMPQIKIDGNLVGGYNQLVEDIGKQVRTMPQIKIDDKLVGGYNQLIEYFADKGLVNFKGEVIDK